MTFPVPPDKDRRRAVVVAIAVVALTMLLRALWIGRLGLHADEDISTLAARAIAAKGFPELPSGHLYWRAPLFHYLLAPWTLIPIDWAPRLFSVLLAGVTAALVVLRGEALVGRTAAWLGGGFFAISLVEISLGRQIRMYSLYEPLALVAILLVYRFWATGEMRWGWLSAAAIFVTLLVHELGATLALLYVPIALRHARARVWAFAAAAVVVFGGLIKLHNQVLGRMFYNGLAAAGEPRLPNPDDVPGAPFRILLSGDPLALSQGTLGLVGLIAVGAALGVAGALIAWRATPGLLPLRRFAAVAALAGALVAAGCAQIGIAAGLLALVALQRGDLFPERAGARALVIAGAVVAVIAAGWLAVGLARGFGAADVVLGLIRWPWRLVRLLLWPPAIAALAVAASLVVARRAWRGVASPGEQFTVLAVGWLVVSRGVLGDRAQLRYLAEVWPLWELLAALAVVMLLDRVRTAAGASARRVVPAVATAVLVAVLLLPGTAPRDLLAFAGRQPGDRRFSPERLDAPAADLRGASAWLAPRLGPDDLVVATDWLTTYCYLNRVDGWLRGSEYGWQTVRVNGVQRDCYVGAQVLPTLAALFEFGRTRQVWIVAGGQELLALGAPLAPEVRAWLLAREPAFIAADGETRVYRVGPFAP